MYTYFLPLNEHTGEYCTPFSLYFCPSPIILLSTQNHLVIQIIWGQMISAHSEQWPTFLMKEDSKMSFLLCFIINNLTQKCDNNFTIFECTVLI